MNKVLLLANHVLTLTQFRMELITRLIADGWGLTVAVPHDGAENQFPGCEVVNVTMNRRGASPIKDIRLFLHYLQIIKQLKPQAVLTFTIKPNLYGGLACVLTKTPQLANVTGLGSGYMRRGPVSAIIQALSWFVYRKAHTVFVQNENNMEILKAHKMLRGNGMLIPGSGVNLTRFVALPYPPENAPVIFHFVARVMREKGIGEYLGAARRICAEHPEAVFRVIGFIEEPAYEIDLRKAQQEGVIKYLGYRDDMPSLTAECACVVNPSYHEGMSNVLLESAACARPVIASDIPGCRECVDEGVTGFLCQACDEDSLFDAMNWFLALPHDQRARMGQAGRGKMEREFDRQKVVEVYIEHLIRIIKR